MLTNIEWSISALRKGNSNGKWGIFRCSVIIIYWIIPSGSSAVDNERQFQHNSFLSERLFSIYQEGDLFSTELLMSYLVCHERHLPGPYRFLIAVCLLYEKRTMVTQMNDSCSLRCVKYCVVYSLSNQKFWSWNNVSVLSYSLIIRDGISSPLSIRDNTCFPNVFSDLYSFFSITEICFEFKPFDNKLSTLRRVHSNA